MPFAMIGLFQGVAYRESDLSLHVDVLAYAREFNILHHPQEDREMWVIATMASACRVARQKYPEFKVRKTYAHVYDGELKKGE